MDEEEQVNALIYIIGIKAIEISKAFVYNKDEDRKKYSNILAKFDIHFVPCTNIIHKRFLFHTWYQRSGEAVEELITALHTLADNCDFKTFRDESICDNIVVGIASLELSRQLQLIPSLTLQKAIEIVRANEDVSLQQVAQREVSQHAQTYNIDLVVQREQPSRGSRKKRSDKTYKECYRCGATSHQGEGCPAKRAKCHKCRWYGHYSKMCCQFSARTSQSRPPNRRVNNISQYSDNYSDSGPSDGEGDSFYIGQVSVGQSHVDFKVHMLVWGGGGSLQ